MAKIQTSEDPVISGGEPKNLHGRRQIFTDQAVITRDTVIEVLSKALAVHWKNREEIIYLEKYLRGKQPILARVKKVNGEINNKIVVNIANEIVTFKTSEFAGEPIQYKSRASDNDDVCDGMAMAALYFDSMNLARVEVVMRPF